MNNAPKIGEPDPGTTEWWREVKKAQSEHNAKRRDDAEDFWTRHAVRWDKHTPTHWTTALVGSKLQYWPSKNKWQWRNKIYTGGPKALFGFMRNQIRKHAE